MANRSKQDADELSPDDEALNVLRLGRQNPNWQDMYSKARDKMKRELVVLNDALKALMSEEQYDTFVKTRAKHDKTGEEVTSIRSALAICGVLACHMTMAGIAGRYSDAQKAAIKRFYDKARRVYTIQLAIGITDTWVKEEPLSFDIEHDLLWTSDHHDNMSMFGFDYTKDVNISMRSFGMLSSVLNSYKVDLDDQTFDELAERLEGAARIASESVRASAFQPTTKPLAAKDKDGQKPES